MIRARQTCFCVLFRSATIASSRARSASIDDDILAHSPRLAPIDAPWDTTLTLQGCKWTAGRASDRAAIRLIAKWWP